MMMILKYKGLSITFLGIIFAFGTFLLPSISILIGRPFSQGNEVLLITIFKKMDLSSIPPSPMKGIVNIVVKYQQVVGINMNIVLSRNNGIR